ncbi:MAG TPA: hypothetical protein VGB79_03040 [Allosphingosinicella sp.]|jgi:hypothetical protein
MSLDAIYASLAGALSDGSVSLGTGGSGEVPPGIAPVLALLGVTDLQIAGARLATDRNAVTLTGTAGFRHYQWAVALTAAADDRLTLSLQCATQRLTIGALFGKQPPALVRSPEGTLSLTEGVLDGLAVDNARLVVRTGDQTARLSSLASLDEGRLLKPYASFFGDRVALEGPVDFTGPLPGFDLKASAPKAGQGWATAVGTVVESSGIAISNRAVDDDPDRLGQPLSTIELYAAMSKPIETELRAPLLRNDSLLDLSFAFREDSHSLAGGLAAIGEFLGIGKASLELPPTFAVLDNFYIRTIGLGIDPHLDAGLPTLEYSSITITSRQPWQTPVPFITVEDVGAQWTFSWLPPEQNQRRWFSNGSVFGTFRFGATKGQAGSGWPLSVVAFLPKFDIWVHSEETLEIPIADALRQFGLNPGKLPSLKVDDIDILGEWDTRTVTASMSVSGDWEIKLKAMTLSLEGLNFQAIVSQNSLSGSIEGIISIDLGTDKATFLLAAEYPGEGNWVFSGGLVDGTLPLIKFAAAFFGQSPNWGADITLTELLFRYDTGPGNPYSVRGRAVAHWNIGGALGIDKLEIEAFGSVEKRAKTALDALRALAAPHLVVGEMIYAGEFSGAFTVNKIKIGAGLTFDDTTKTYFFYVDWETGQIKAIASLVDAGTADERRVITITLKGVTVGALVERLVNLVNPNLNYTLDPPWDVLNRIDLSRFSLVIDYKKSKVQLRFQADLGIPLLKLDWVGVTYDRSSGEPSVRFELGGEFLGKTYGKGGKPALSWDAIKDPPPETPGQGVRLIDIRYFGLGQHVTIDGIRAYQSVAKLVDKLREEMVPPKTAQANPIAGTSLVFAPDSQWLIGLDLKVMEFLRVAVVLNDPSLYGMVISLSGDKAKSLAGLSFELLYKKVTDDIGMFRVRLQIPDAYREINLGAVAITMGVITVDIYTNGNFRVDLGFPAKRDFSNSFGFQFGPFNGKGGLYFALLNGATSTRVPAVTNGSFSPVIELGIGLQVGVGRTFNKGPLSAGLTVDVEGVFMGVLGWFHPDDAAKGTELYYWVQGIVAITGKLYGKVDFKIISVSISIEAHASVTVTVECYMPTLIELEVGVTVEAEVDLCLFTISFSFDMTLQASFTIGQAEPTPWILAADQSGRGRDIRAAHRRRPAALRRRPADMARLTRPAFHAARTALAAGEEWNPEQGLFKGGAAVGVHLFITPAFPVADVPVDWPGGRVEPVAPPRRCIDLLLAATPPTQRVPNVADVSFNNLIDLAFRWALTGAGVAPFGSLVTPAALAEVARLLDGPAGDQGFSYANLKLLFARNLRLRIELAPTDSVSNGVAFPMPPPLAWTGAAGLPDPLDASRDFTSYMLVDSNYEAALKTYLDALLPSVPFPEPAADASLSTAIVEPSESMATFVFRDYFQMIAKAAVAKAADLLTSHSISFDPNKSLAAAAQSFERVDVTITKNAGDTLDQVAASLGYSGPEIAFLNSGIAERIAAAAAGAPIPVTLGITPQAIALVNPGLALRAGTLVLGDLAYQVRAGQSLGAIATLFGLDLKTWLAGSELAGAPRLLAPGAELPLTGYDYDNSSARPTATLAAILFVRLSGWTDVPLVEWYAQRILDLNLGLMLDPLEPGLPVTAASLLVPDAYQSQGSIAWTTLPGDTVRDLAAYCALVQNGAADPDFSDFLTRFLARNPGAPAIVHLPDSTSTRIGADENLTAVAARLLLAPAGDTFVELVRNAAILRPLAPVTVRGATANVTADQSLAELSRACGLDIETLASRVAGLPNLFAATATRIVVPHLVAMKVEDLVGALLAEGRATDIANQVSRFMLHGLRIPAPVLGAGGTWAPTGPFAALYALTGQQVLGRAPVTPAAAPITIPFAVPGGKVDWLQLGAAPDPNSSGTLTVTVTDQDLADFGCEPALRPQFDSTPPPPGPPQPAPPAQVAPLWTDQSPRWDLSQHILLQVAQPILLPGPAAAASAPMPGLWPLPPALLARAGGASDYSLDVVSGDGAATGVGHWAWAATIDFHVRRVPGAPDLFEVFGADTAARQQLLQVWTDLTANPGKAKLLYRPSAAGGLPPGLVALSLETVAGAYLIKENLSTETHSGVLAQRALLGDDAALFVAPISDAKAFAQLLWECSVVGGGGFWLRAAGPDGAPALPGSAFGGDGRAVLTILVTIDSQLAATPVRRLLASNNCALIGDPIDPSARLAASTADPAAKVRLPIVQPGNVGFEFTLFQPPPPPTLRDPAADKQARTRRYYQLAGYQLIGNDSFAQQGPSVPIGPLKPVKKADGLERWRYSQVLPAARLAAHHGLPELAGLPDRMLDPYAGIRLVGDPQQLAALRVELWFQDMLGNASAGAPALLPPSSQPGPLGHNQFEIPVGYMDPVIGFGSWPAATAAFQVVNMGVTPTPTLKVMLGFQPGPYQPGPNEVPEPVHRLQLSGEESPNAPTTSRQRAADHRDRYASIYFQIMQGDVEANLLTSLHCGAGGKPIRLGGQIQTLRSQAIAAWLYLSGAARLSNITSGPDCATLDDVSARHGVWFQGLAAANANVPLAGIFKPAQLSAPLFSIVRAGDRPLDFAGSGAASVLQKAQNIAIPLRAGAGLSIPRHSLTTASGAASTFATLAAAALCPTAALIRANGQTAGLLTLGFVFQHQDAEVTVGHGDATLDDVARTFRDQAGVEVDTLTLGMEYADFPGLIMPDAVYWLDSYTAQPGDTLGVNRSGASILDLATANVETRDLYVAGTPIFLDSVDATALRTRSLGEAAQVLGISGEQLLAYNHDTLSNPVVLPGHAAAPADSAIAYAVQADDTLESIAGRFAAPPASADPVRALAAANAALPGLLAPKRSISLAGRTTPVETRAGDSLQSVADRFAPVATVAELADAIRRQPGYLAVGWTMLCPPATISGGSLASVALSYGVDAVSLALANAGTPGILKAGARFIVSKEGKEYQVVLPASPAVSRYPLNSVVTQFAKLPQHVEVTLAEVAAANLSSDIFAPCSLVLPPPSLSLTAALDRNPARLPGEIFPLQAWIEIRRPEKKLVLPDFQGTDDEPSPAQRSLSAVAALGAPRPTDAGSPPDPALALAAFATSLQEALPALRVCTGKVAGHPDERADAWAIGFGCGLIDFTVRPETGGMPRVFALRPLFNHLVTRTLSIPGLNPDGSRSPAVRTEFQSVDTEIFARDFLADIDLFLSAPYSAAAYRGAKSNLERVIAAKQKLAGAVADGLAAVLKEEPCIPVPQVPPDLKSAREFLRQRLLNGLGGAWRTDLVLQYATTATHGAPSASGARLAGTAVAMKDGADGARIVIDSGKIELAAAEGFLNLGITLQHGDSSRPFAEEARQSFLRLHLDYSVKEVEFDIRDVADGYAASDWLSFVLPHDPLRDLPGWSIALGDLMQAPLPLRSYPEPAVLTGHGASPTHAETTEWAQAPFWTYAFTYQHSSAAQDQIRIDVSLNQPDRQLVSDALVAEDIFAVLAEYHSIRSQLWDLLKALPATRQIDAGAPISAAIGILADFAERARNAWQSHWGGPVPESIAGAARMDDPLPGGIVAPIPETAQYLISSNGEEGLYTALILDRTLASTGPVRWPVIKVAVPNRDPLELIRGVPTAARCVYAFPAGARIEMGAPLTVSIAFEGLHVSRYQRASADVAVIRNARLLGPDGPATADAFRFETLPVAFPAPVAPLLVWDEFDIGPWSAGGVALATAMAGLLDGLTAGERPVSFLLEYGYELIEGAGMRTRLPVALKPTAGYQASDSVDIDVYLVGWQREARPSTRHGEWVISPTLFSSLTADRTKPLLQIRQLVSRLQAGREDGAD